MSSRTERLLRDALSELDYGALKVDMGTGHGVHIDRDCGDLIAGTNDYRRGPEKETITVSDLYVIEEKYTSAETDPRVYVDIDKLLGMIEFGSVIGATPVLSVRFSTGNSWESPGADHYHIRADEIDFDHDANEFTVPPDYVIDGTPDSFSDQEFVATEVFFDGE